MDHAALPHEHHGRLDGLDGLADHADHADHAAVLARDGDPDLSALERCASSGCSACARALVNAREALVSLAAATASAVAPGAALRERVLSSARRRAGADAADPRARGRDAARLRDALPLRDPSATVAHLHLGDPGEAARAREVELLDALRAPPDSSDARALAALSRLTGYPILFISILQGARVGYRAQHGLPPELADAPRAPQIRREMTFCTHCVSAGAPLVVEDAAREPFFRGSKMVQRFGLRAYMGVPLRTSSGVILGTLCALDVAPRPGDPRSLALLELFAEPIVAEMERGRDEAAAARRDALLEPLAGGPPIHAAPWFSRLLDLALLACRPRATRATRATNTHREAAEARPVALVTLTGPGAREAAARAEAGEVVGRFPGNSDALGVLLAGAGPDAAAARCAAFRAACPGAAYALAGRGSAGSLGWASAAPALDVVDVVAPGSA